MGAYPKVGLLCCLFTVTFTTAICPIPYRHICILRKHIFYFTIYFYKRTSYIYVVFGTRYKILLYSSLYSIYTQLHSILAIHYYCYNSVITVTCRPYVYCVTDFHTRLQTIYTSIYFIQNINILRNIHIYILYTQDTYLLIYIRPFQIQVI